MEENQKLKDGLLYYINERENLYQKLYCLKDYDMTSIRSIEQYNNDLIRYNTLNEFLSKLGITKL